MQNSKIAPDPPDMGIYIRCLLESFSALVWLRIYRIKMLCRLILSTMYTFGMSK